MIYSNNVDNTNSSKRSLAYWRNVYLKELLSLVSIL